MTQVPTESASGLSRSVRSNTIAALIGDGLQLVLGLLAFFLLADALGKEEFGIYGAVIAMATFATPVGSAGAQSLLMLDMAAGQSFRTLWSRSISMVVFGGVTTTLLALPFQPLILPDLSRVAFATLFLSQTAFFAVTEFCVIGTQAHRRLTVSIVLRFIVGSIRLIAVWLFVVFATPTVESWSVFALLAWIVGALLCLAVIRVAFGPWPTLSLPKLTDIRRGWPYAFGSATTFALDAVDRPMLVALGDAGAAGLYNAGYRLAQVADVPIVALVRATDADFFAAGRSSAADARALARRTVVVASAYGVLAGIGIYVCAPILPFLLGDDWNESVEVLRLLSVLPFFRGLRIFPANALTGMGLQNLRNRAFLAALALNIPLNAVLIPRYSWSGAVVATIASEILMAALLWGLIYRVSTNDLQPETSQ